MVAVGESKCEESTHGHEDATARRAAGKSYHGGAGGTDLTQCVIFVRLFEQSQRHTPTPQFNTG